MHHPKGFPSKLVRLRAEAGMTQKDLAKASGISVPQIGRYETGVSKPRMTAIVKLARALDVDASELVESDDYPEMFEISVISTDGSSSPIALPKSTIDWLQADADKHGVTLEATLAAMITFAKEKNEGSEVTYEEVLAETVELLDKWPTLRQSTKE
ncbi:helix-turn-helix domain-containing protein [Azotobacter salinestris]|uniref:helix-turn-helix domain-containing protein n=1 Tax=Azotobacter salinestris TaxID=69964 RepID=UPI0032DF4566